MAIKIKPSKRGTLHDALGIPRDKKIPASKLSIKPGDSPALKKKKQFAINARKWNKGQMGIKVEDPFSEPPISEEDLTVEPLESNILEPKREEEMDTEANAIYERSNKKFQKQYDRNLGRAVVQTGTDEEKNKYRDFYKEKYNEDLFDTSDLSGTLATIIAGINKIIPEDKPENPIVRPLSSYNPYSEGTGSQAIAYNGIKLSKMGYKSNSKDKNKKALRIPSNNITMEGVPHPILGIDDTGYQQIMLPEENYEFPGNYVDEFPLTAKGGLNFKSPQAYKAWLAYGHASGEFAKTPGHQKVSIKGKAKKVQHGQEGYHMMPDGTMMADSEMKKGGKISPQKARKILHDGEVRGHKLTEKQRRFFGAMSNAQAGAVFTSQSQIEEANKLAKRLSLKDKTFAGENAYVAKSVGDPVPQFLDEFGRPYTPTPTRKLRTTIPSNVQMSDIQIQDGLAWYNDPTTGDVVDLDLSIINHPYFRKSKETVSQDLSQRTTKMTPRSLKSGGKIQPLTEDTIKFNGPSHANGGINISYANQGVEVEGGETGYISPIDGSLNVMGNMINPLTNRKFKEDSKRIAKKEQKIDKLLDYSTDLILDNDPMDKWQSLSFNSGRVQMAGAAMKKQELQQSKEHLSNIQKAMLEFAQENNLDPEAFSKGQNKEAKCGTKIKGQAGASLAQRHFNPGNLMYADWEKKYGATKGDARYDKSGKLIGHFAKFPDFASGQKAMKALLTGKSYNNLTVEQASSKWTAEGPYKNIPYNIRTKKIKDLSPEELKLTLDTFTMGEDSKKYNWENLPDTPVTTVNAPEVPYEPLEFDPKKPTAFGDPQYVPQTVTPGTYDLGITTPRAYNKPTNARGLSFNQIAPELYAAATNQVEPVFMQQYTPDLYQDYRVSFQDQLNENQAMFRALSRSNAGNPEVQSVLAGEAYQRAQGALANEFRTNQAIQQDVVNKNIALLNDAELKNLQLADTQYVRQSQAKSATKAVNQQVLSSIADKIHLNELENRTLQVYENLYPNFYFDEEANYKQSFTGPKGQEMINWGSSPTPQQSDAQTTVRTDNKGNITTIKRYPSNLQQQLQNIRLQTSKFNYTRGFMDWLKNNR